MGTSEKQLYKEYQKVLKETGIKQFTDEEYQKAIERLKTIKKGKRNDTGEV